MLCLETLSVELHGRSHPAPRLYEGGLLSGRPHVLAGGTMYTVSTRPVRSLQGWPTLYVTRTLTRFALDHPDAYGLGAPVEGPPRR